MLVAVIALAAHALLLPRAGAPSMVAAAAVKLDGSKAPSWETLSSQVAATSTGARLADEAALREQGKGGAHTDALLRLFDAPSESDVRVTLYRDDAAWCP